MHNRRSNRKQRIARVSVSFGAASWMASPGGGSGITRGTGSEKKPVLETKSSEPTEYRNYLTCRLGVLLDGNKAIPTPQRTSWWSVRRWNNSTMNRTWAEGPQNSTDAGSSTTTITR